MNRKLPSVGATSVQLFPGTSDGVAVVIFPLESGVRCSRNRHLLHLLLLLLLFEEGQTVAALS